MGCAATRMQARRLQPPAGFNPAHPHLCPSPFRVAQLRKQALCRRILLVCGQHGDDAADGVASAAQVGGDGAAHGAQNGTTRVHMGQRLDGRHILLDDVSGGGACSRVREGVGQGGGGAGLEETQRLHWGVSFRLLPRSQGPSCSPTRVQQAVHEGLAEQGDELAVQVGVLQAVADVLDGGQAAEQLGVRGWGWDRAAEGQ